MIRHDILHEIKSARQRVSFIYPYYGAYSVAELPPSIRLWLGLPSSHRPLLPFAGRWNHGYKRVLFFFIDGLGYDHFVDYEDSLPFFHRLVRKGEVYPLTSVFPSTTPAALTTLHTNKTPQEHGLPEWTVYFEECDRVIETFPFRTHLSGEREALLAEGGRPEMLYEGKTFYEELAEEGIASYVFMSADYAAGSYALVSHRGATTVPFANAEDLAAELVRVLKEERRPCYLFAYWGHVDAIEHIYGPRSKEHLETLALISLLLERDVAAKLEPDDARDVLFVLSSDHGQTSIRNEDIIYLNDYIDLEANYARSPSSKTIYPTGAPHDVFLYIYGPRREETIGYLRAQLEGKAEVIPTEEALARGLFGTGEPSERFLRRIGDVLILPYEGYHVWYKHAPDLSFGQRGIHGGLSQREMIVPLAIAPLSDLLPAPAAA